MLVRSVKGQGTPQQSNPPLSTHTRTCTRTCTYIAILMRASTTGHARIRALLVCRTMRQRTRTYSHSHRGRTHLIEPPLIVLHQSSILHNLQPAVLQPCAAKRRPRMDGHAGLCVFQVGHDGHGEEVRIERQLRQRLATAHVHAVEISVEDFSIVYASLQAHRELRVGQLANVHSIRHGYHRTCTRLTGQAGQGEGI